MAENIKRWVVTIGTTDRLVEAPTELQSKELALGERCTAEEVAVLMRSIGFSTTRNKVAIRLAGMVEALKVNVAGGTAKDKVRRYCHRDPPVATDVTGVRKQSKLASSNRAPWILHGKY